jgi:hypothetical protein
MLFIKLCFQCKNENCIWRHPFVTSDKGFDDFSFSNVRLSKTEKQYKNAGWQLGMFPIVLKLI